MKKSDIAMIILIASLSVMVAFAVANSLPFLKVDRAGAKVQTIEEIDSGITDPDPTVFNNNAINPTIRSVIGGGGDD